MSADNPAPPEDEKLKGREDSSEPDSSSSPSLAPDNSTAAASEKEAVTASSQAASSGDKAVEQETDKSNKDGEKKDSAKVTKIEVRLQPTGDAPIMKKRKWTVDPQKTVGQINKFVRGYLKLDDKENLFMYVNQAFAPSPDQTVENLYQCFGSDGNLVLHYSKSQAWG